MPGHLSHRSQAGAGLADEIIDHAGATQTELRHDGVQINPQRGVAQTGAQTILHRPGNAHDQRGDLRQRGMQAAFPLCQDSTTVLQTSCGARFHSTQSQPAGRDSKAGKTAVGPAQIDGGKHIHGLRSPYDMFPPAYA